MIGNLTKELSSAAAGYLNINNTDIYLYEQVKFIH